MWKRKWLAISVRNSFFLSFFYSITSSPFSPFSIFLLPYSSSSIVSSLLYCLTIHLFLIIPTRVWTCTLKKEVTLIYLIFSMFLNSNNNNNNSLKVRNTYSDIYSLDITCFPLVLLISMLIYLWCINMHNVCSVALRFIHE